MEWLIVVAFFSIGCYVNSENVENYGENIENNSEINLIGDRILLPSKNDNDYKDFSWENYKNAKFEYDEDDKKKLDEIFGYTGPTANDEPENLLRPCALDDWQCIRKYFAANSKCTPSYWPIPDPLKLDLLTLHFPTINTTLTLPNHVVRGLSSAKIREFYVNRKSGNLVFAIEVQNLNQTTARGYYRYRRTSKEPIILADYNTINFVSVTYTVVKPKVPHLRLDLADIHADVKDGAPVIFIGPGAVNSTDPDVIQASAELLTMLPFVVREGFLFESQLFASIYIQANICDFGLKLIST